MANINIYYKMIKKVYNMNYDKNIPIDNLLQLII